MSVFDQELILPGVITDIVSEYSSGYDTSLFGSTDSITIIGTAFNGPVGKPVAVYSPEHARYVFGSTFDFTTRREATLVAEIEDAWARGCRTIYAVRVSGKEIHKDFQLASNAKCKLRVSGIFPNNANKDVFFEYDTPDTLADQANGVEPLIKIYKPADRATIEEKMLGRVTRQDSVLVNSVKIKSNWNITDSTRLVDFIKLFNEYRYNNVLILSIVDENGNDITETSLAQGLMFEDLFPGVYFIGRDKNSDKITAKTVLKTELSTETDSMVDDYKALLKQLVCNTDVTKDLPIYSNDVNEMGQLIGGEVTMVKMFDFLEIPGKVDSVWLKDKIDYEEVKLSDFDMYKKLGSGFASTAKITEIKDGVYKVVEVTDDNDTNKIAGLNDGVYSMLENLRSDYRVLTGKYADTEINASLPKREEFLVSNPVTGTIFAKNVAPETKEAVSGKFVSGGLVIGHGSIVRMAAEDDRVKVMPKIDKKDLSAPVTYTFEIKPLEEDADILSKRAVLEQLHTPVVGTYPMEDADKAEFIASTGKYIVLEVEGDYVVFGKAEGEIEALARLEDVLAESSNMFVTIVPSLVQAATKDVVIRVTGVETTTLREFIISLNENEVLNKKFEFDFASGLTETEKYELVVDSIDLAIISTFTDRSENLQYDKSLYIPYKTTDNFARQLAQHCIYTSLKTAPTHGVIGCSKITSVNLNGIAERVEKLVNLDLNLYAKKPNGNDMLDRNNIPYPIGRALSVTFFQTRIETGDNYSYISTGASSYAGMVSSLPIDQSSTSQPIDLSSISFELTNYQLARLTQAGFVTVKNSYTKGYVVTDGVTMAPVTSPFRRLSVTRIINGIDEAIRSASEPFIGKQNHLANRNSLQTAIKSSLDKMLDTLIERYDFKLIVDRNAERMGIIEIEYDIVPIYEIREVRNRVSVKDGQ